MGPRGMRDPGAGGGLGGHCAAVRLGAGAGVRGGGHGETRDWMEGREVKGNAELPLSGVGLARPDRGQPVGAGMALSRASRPLLS